MTHPHAAPVTRHRLKVARLVIDDGWPISEVDARFQVSWPTVKSWVLRYRVGQSMQDRSSRPHHSPNKTSAKTGRRCIALRLRLHEGPVQLAVRLGIASSTVHRIPTSVHLNRLSHVDRATGEPIRRYDHDHPGSRIHVDVKKLGKPRNRHSGPLLGCAYARCSASEAERRGELHGWLNNFNHHRPHTVCSSRPPFSRFINVPGQYT